MAVASIFFAEATLLALIGGVLGFAAGGAGAPDWASIFNSQISIPPVLLPVILAIAVMVTFAGKRGGDSAGGWSGSGVCVARRIVSVPISHSAQELAASRAGIRIRRCSMRMLVRAAVLRRGRATSALFAMVVAAAVATAMLNLYVDVQAKLRREFRNYGANIIARRKDGGFPARGRFGTGGIHSWEARHRGAVWDGRGAN